MGFPGIYLPPELLDSKAFRILKHWELRTLIGFYRRRQFGQAHGKRSQRPIVNNGEIVFTYKRARELGIRPDQFRDALDGLISKGFLEIEHPGTGQGDPTLYYVSNRWEKWDTHDFKPVPLDRQRRKNTSERSGWAVYHHRQKPTTENRTTITAEIRTKKEESHNLRYAKSYHNKDGRINITQ